MICCNYLLFIAYQQQHSSKLQLVHTLADILNTQSSGKHLQSAHFICISMKSFS